MSKNRANAQDFGLACLLFLFVLLTLWQVRCSQNVFSGGFQRKIVAKTKQKMVANALCVALIFVISQSETLHLHKNA